MRILTPSLSPLYTRVVSLIESTTPKIAVVCRYNQARSVLAAAALGRYFPFAKISSAGVNAEDGSPIPESIVSIAQYWGIDLSHTVSRSVPTAAADLKEADLIIVAESEFATELVEMGIFPEKILSMQDDRFLHAFIPFDPVNRDQEDVAVETAKAIMVTLQHVRSSHLFAYKNDVEVYIPETHSDFEEGVRRIWEYAQAKGANLLVADFRAPDTQSVQNLNVVVRELSKVHKGGENELELTALQSDSPYVVALRYEMNYVEKYALSVNFENIISLLAQERPLVIVTGPAKLDHSQNADPFLIASHATRVFPLAF